MKRTLSALLAVSLLAMFPAGSPVTADAASDTALSPDEIMPWETVSDNVYNKIHFYVGSDDYATIDSAGELDDAVNDVNELSPTSPSNSRNAASQDIQLFIQFKSSISDNPEYKELLAERHTLTSLEETDEWRSRLNRFSKEYHDALVYEGINDTPALNGSDYTHIDYSPFIFINTSSRDIDKDCLTELAFNDSTENIVIDTPPEYAEDASWEDTLDHINATSIVNSSKYKGKGINVGVLEVGGVCDRSDEFLSARNITIQNSSSPISEHATDVVSVIANLAPDANYYVAEMPQTGAIPFEWFLENNCQVINMSFSVIHPQILEEKIIYDVNGRPIKTEITYANQDFKYMPHVNGLVDYMIYNHEISVVVSAGNFVSSSKYPTFNNDFEITSPGYAHNAVTVGGAYYNERNQIIMHSPTACFVSDDGIMKPNISAISSNLVLPSDSTAFLNGTSFSAPQVTAAIALLINKKSSYGIFPSRPLAMLMASADKVTGYDTVDDNENGYFDLEVGAGLLNIEALLMDTNVRLFESIKEEKGTIVGRQKVQLNKGDKFQISIVWTPIAVQSSTYYTDIQGIQYNNYTPYVSNYKLALCDTQTGEVVAQSDLSFGNVELIRYTVQHAGEYEITVMLNSDMAEAIEGDVISLAYTVK